MTSFPGNFETTDRGLGEIHGQRYDAQGVPWRSTQLLGTDGADMLTIGIGFEARGGVGNDTYVVDNPASTVVENSNEGSDTVQTSVSYTLSRNIENITLTGTSTINATGNTLNNVLSGNSAANILEGGAGNDTYVFGRGSGADTIFENDYTTGNTDVLSVTSGVANNQLWFRKMGNDLRVDIVGTTDSTTVRSWYQGDQYKVEQFKTSDGKTLLSTDVDKLVQAMAAFTPPAAGQTTLPPAYQTALAPVLAANWK